MSPLLSVWLWIIISLLPLEIQTEALPAHRQRLLKSSTFPIMPTASDLTVALDDIAPGDRHITWRALLHKDTPPRSSGPLPKQSYHAISEGPTWHRGSRGRRHAHYGGMGRSHGQLMRVGCVLGTCQVQNLSHRLYQLIGQSGREDSSPINPRSPHSYG